MQTLMSHRIVLIRSTATPAKTSRRRAAVQGQRASTRRIVIIKDGEFVRRKPRC
jgi:hypothetical protein